jgi:transposase-like protein
VPTGYPLGRTARHERRDEDGPAGYRNGAVDGEDDDGPVELQRPKLRDTDQRFCSRLFGDGVTRTNALEALVISGWVRGLSDRDIEATLGAVLGGQAALSRSTVSRICSAIKDEFAAWARLPNGHHQNNRRDSCGQHADITYRCPHCAVTFAGLTTCARARSSKQ